MTPLALTDDQLKVVIDAARVVPVLLRGRYLKDIAERLPVNGNVERVISFVLRRLSRRNAEKQKAYRQRDANGERVYRVYIWPQVIECLIDTARLTDVQTKTGGQGGCSKLRTHHVTEFAFRRFL